MPDANFERQDAAYLAAKTLDPGLTFAQFYMGRVLELIEDGKDHATLGPKLTSGKSLMQAGEKSYAKLKKLFPPAPATKVVDYGCGSLRLGAHYIQDLSPGCYFGLDVTTGFLDYGKEMLGEAVLAQKAPRFAAISPQSVAQAAKFGADLVLSTAVAHHVHPDDSRFYFDSLKTMAGKPGAILYFDMAVTEGAGFRYKHRCWARPLEYFLEALSPLAFIQLHRSSDRVFESPQGPRPFHVGALEFRRA